MMHLSRDRRRQRNAAPTLPTAASPASTTEAESIAEVADFGFGFINYVRVPDALFLPCPTKLGIQFFPLKTRRKGEEGKGRKEEEI